MKEDNIRESYVDSRPSDMIAMCLRFDAPIFVEDGLLSTCDKILRESLECVVPSFEEKADHVLEIVLQIDKDTFH